MTRSRPDSSASGQFRSEFPIVMIVDSSEGRFFLEEPVKQSFSYECFGWIKLWHRQAAVAELDEQDACLSKAKHSTERDEFGVRHDYRV